MIQSFPDFSSKIRLLERAVSPVRDGLVADGVANVQVLNRAVKLFVVEGTAEQRSAQRLDLPTPSEGWYLLRVDTQGPAESSLGFSRSLLLAPPPPPGPDCDPDHIDRANPNWLATYLLTTRLKTSSHDSED